MVLLPRRRGPKPNFAPGRQSILVDAPTLQLPPIENWLQNFLVIGNRNVRSILPIENTQRKPSRHPTDAIWTNHKPTNAAFPHKGLAVNERWPVGSFGDKLTGFVREIMFSSNICGEPDVHHC